jgi:hypothetical protein
LLLLQHGSDVNVVNKEGNTAAQVTKEAEIRELIEGSLLENFHLANKNFSRVCERMLHEALRHPRDGFCDAWMLRDAFFHVFLSLVVALCLICLVVTAKVLNDLSIQ